MPIFNQSYRTFDGQLRARFRWAIMVKQELRILFASRFFVTMLIIGMMHVCMRVLQIVAYDILSQNPNSQINIMLQQVELLTVNPKMFFDFIRIQAPLVFMTAMFAGSGSICNDFRNNLMEIYFSKPLSHWDYILGKTMTLVLIGFTLTALPGIGLVILHNLLAPGLITFHATWWTPFSIAAFSSIVVLPCALGVLAFSAMFRSQRFASVGVFMVLFGNMIVARMLSDALHSKKYLVMALPVAINHLGEYLFAARRHVFDLPWGWSAFVVALVCIFSLMVVHLKIRRAEVAA